jgi:hypothetical protein
MRTLAEMHGRVSAPLPRHIARSGEENAATTRSLRRLVRAEPGLATRVFWGNPSVPAIRLRAGCGTARRPRGMQLQWGFQWRSTAAPRPDAQIIASGNPCLVIRLIPPPAAPSWLGRTTSVQPRSRTTQLTLTLAGRACRRRALRPCRYWPARGLSTGPGPGSRWSSFRGAGQPQRQNLLYDQACLADLEPARSGRARAWCLGRSRCCTDTIVRRRSR